MRRLLKEYRATLRLVNKHLYNMEKGSQDYQLLSSSISDLHYIIEWLRIGHRPGSTRGIERLSHCQREIPMDPQNRKFMALADSAGISQGDKLTDDDLSKLNDILAGLSEREREVFVMVKGSGLSLGYVAAMLNISKSSVQEYLNRAQESIQHEVNKGVQMTMFG